MTAPPPAMLSSTRNLIPLQRRALKGNAHRLRPDPALTSTMPSLRSWMASAARADTPWVPAPGGGSRVPRWASPAMRAAVRHTYSN